MKPTPPAAGLGCGGADTTPARITGPSGDGFTVAPVKTGLDNGTKAEILEGLEEGAEVLVTKPVEDPKNPGGRPRLRF